MDQVTQLPAPGEVQHFLSPVLASNATSMEGLYF
jgi:hypothetical protein